MKQKALEKEEKDRLAEIDRITDLAKAETERIFIKAEAEALRIRSEKDAADEKARLAEWARIKEEEIKAAALEEEQRLEAELKF